MHWSRTAALTVGALVALTLLSSCKGKSQEEGGVATPPQQIKSDTGMQGHKMGEPLSAEELAKMKAGVASGGPGN